MIRCKKECDSENAEKTVTEAGVKQLMDDGPV